MSEIWIPVYQPDLGGNEKKYVMECLDSTWISSKGRFISEFEESFARFCGVRHATSVCNGTVAVHLTLLALGVGPGDEVIVPSLTYVASVNAVGYVGATPVFVDSLPGTLQMDPDDVRRKISARTKAVMAVHLYGHPCDMDGLRDAIEGREIHLVEDCAEAIGTRYRDQHVGTFGEIAAFSFFGNKTITTGEGGMVVTDNTELFNLAKRFKGQGLAANAEYWHDLIGYNYRMTNICAALGLAQMERIESILERKRAVSVRYKDGLKGLPLTLHSAVGPVDHSYWMITVLLDEPGLRDDLRAALSKAGIETRPVFPLVHTMPMYRKENLRLPNAERISHAGLNLPSYPDLSTEQIDYVCGEVTKFLSSAAT